MTNNNLRYAQLLEDKRHNAASELTEAIKAAEAARHNRADEGQQSAELSEQRRYNSGRLAQSSAELFETNRANLARERELNRSNLVRETETNRANIAAENERNRSNLKMEQLTKLRDALNYEIRQRELNENIEHNAFMEDELQRSHLASENIADRNAKTQFWKGLGDFGLGLSKEVRSWVGRPSSVFQGGN